MSNSIAIKIVEGGVAPRYNPEQTKQLEARVAVITENGMQSGLPVVDIQMVDAEGNEYFFMVTGRIFNSVTDIIKAVNMKNHGAEEPDI